MINTKSGVDHTRIAVFSCYDTGEIVEKNECFPAGFSIVKKYPVVYSENLPRFKNKPHFYGQPCHEKPDRLYLGVDREGMSPFVPNIRRRRKKGENDRLARLQDVESSEYAMIENEEDAVFLLGMSLDAYNYEIIHTKVVGSDESYPFNFRFLGYDVCCEVDCSGAFSVICDCLFICRWHGCDKEGTLFQDDFDKLNENGLFDSWDDAYSYMVKYLNEDWSERGDFSIYEVRTMTTKNGA